MWSESSKDYLCDVGLYAFFLTTAKLILYETTTEEEKITSKCQAVYFA